MSFYFVNHQLHPFHDSPRILRFDRDSSQWEQDVRFMWEDLADPLEDIDVILVRPSPPFFAFRGTVGTAIAQQRPQPDRAACLLTAILPMSPDFRIIQSARSLSLEIPHQTLINLAGVAQQREQAGFAPCTLQVGTEVLNPMHDVHTSTGLGIVIQVPPMMSEADVEHNFVLRLRQETDVPELTTSAEPEDAVSLMARQPRPAARIAPSLSSSTTSYSSLLRLPEKEMIGTFDVL